MWIQRTGGRKMGQMLALPDRAWLQIIKRILEGWIFVINCASNTQSVDHKKNGGNI